MRLYELKCNREFQLDTLLAVFHTVHMMHHTAQALHSSARYVGYCSVAMMLGLAGMTWVLNSNWFILATSHSAGPDALNSPLVLDHIAPVLVLILGFITILAALCGAFRRKI